MKIKTLGMAALLLVGASGAQAQSFDVSDIRVEGLQRVSAASVFNAFPVSANDRVDEQQLAAAARDLFATGLFEDVSLAREGDVLVIQVVERPTIARLNIEGNDQISDEDLRNGLRESGLSEGQVLQLSTLDEIERELEGVYQAQGRYSAGINVDVEEILTDIYSRSNHEEPRPKTVPKAYADKRGNRYLLAPKPAPPKLRPVTQKEERAPL